ncbi:TPA: phage tail protein [Escherichia coli]
MLRVALYAVSGLLGALLSPIGLVVTALAGVALVVWKYWQPITAFLGGVVEGFKAAAGPISAAFEPLKPVFQWIGDKVQALWGWFTDLLTPVKSTSAELQSAAAMGRRFGEALAGPDNDMLTLSGVLMPEITGGRLSLLALEQMAEQGKAWPLIEGSGTIYGMYVIEGLNQTKTEFFRDGMPRRIEFTLSLKRVDESLSDMFGDLSTQLNNLQDTATSALSDISKTVGGLLS